MVGVLAPQSSSLLGLVSVVAPAIATGNTVVVVASQDRPLPAITLSEVLATSDVPGGVVNILTGRTAELAPWLASHADVNALDLAGAPQSMTDRAGEVRGEHGEAGPAREAGRAGLGRAAGHVAAARLPGDEDRLAPDGSVKPIGLPANVTAWQRGDP